MMTVRQIERLWMAKQFGKMVRELVANRPEAAIVGDVEGARAVPAAAVAIVRLDELSQAHVPLYGRLVRTILAAQESDGGWGDPLTTALCLRGLLCGAGNGAAISLGMQYLANLQKSEGIWPQVPIRRADSDPRGSAFILFALGASDTFAEAVRLTEAVQWFTRHRDHLDTDTRRLWDHAALRCHVGQDSQMEAMIWS